jgi:hypothetical protein
LITTGDKNTKYAGSANFTIRDLANWKNKSTSLSEKHQHPPKAVRLRKNKQIHKFRNINGASKRF